MSRPGRRFPVVVLFVALLALGACSAGGTSGDGASASETSSSNRQRPVGISPADLTLPDSLENGALVNAATGQEASGTVGRTTTYGVPGELDRPVGVTIFDQPPPSMDELRERYPDGEADGTTLCRNDQEGISCTALLDGGYFAVSFVDVPSTSGVEFPADLDEALRRTESYLEASQA